ncbi:MAG: RraA family protein [Fimbriimonadaceae bacterium]
MSEREVLLAAFERVRVADVRDAMDTVGLHGVGSLSPEIRPLFRTRVVGLAKTARYVPYQGSTPVGEPHSYAAWAGRYYAEVCTYPWVEDLAPGDFVCLDLSGVDAGLMGSENTLACRQRGAVGFVSSDGMRDTDELILQRIPFWSRYAAQSMVQGRIQFESMNQTIAIAGATIVPGDVVVADGDGVIVVPAKVAIDVAQLARAEWERDKAVRRRHYEALDLPADDSVQ